VIKLSIKYYQICKIKAIERQKQQKQQKQKAIEQQKQRLFLIKKDTVD
jgi:hypothetical protein